MASLPWSGTKHTHSIFCCSLSAPYWHSAHGIVQQGRIIWCHSASNNESLWQRRYPPPQFSHTKILRPSHDNKHFNTTDLPLFSVQVAVFQQTSSPKLWSCSCFLESVTCSAHGTPHNFTTVATLRVVYGVQCLRLFVYCLFEQPCINVCFLSVFVLFCVGQWPQGRPTPHTGCTTNCLQDSVSAVISRPRPYRMKQKKNKEEEKKNIS
jgi:hypothetical protein